ncbi:hypothetical protein F8M41_007755 [Gigaspora margarita]|uniref:F-box domain-containing protein n=1 Tax=Gigaspora margarita TaxID=4874 RepID=A0A8H3X627_GIGMA|nr:hypothetical protein F8M41_007755 [Gigaspora margarita]
MASKIFMGDIPELMEIILNNLNGEFKSLYSCALVSRHWCKIAIPILWRDPFSFDQKPMFISRYFSSLNEEDKFIVESYGLNIDFPNTLFYYAKFLKILNLLCLMDKVEKWIQFKIFGSQERITLNTVRDNITNLLFKLFVESGATLSKLDFDISNFTIKPKVFYSLGKNDHFFSKLQDIIISVETESDFLNIEENDTLLRILAKKATKVYTLKLDLFDYILKPRLYRALANIIKSQEHLRRFELSCEEGLQSEFYGVISALESQRYTLQEIKLDNCAYSTEFNVLKNCDKLEELHILNCEEEELLKVLDTDFCHISTLEICSYSIDASILIPILENLGIFLQRLKLYSDNQEIYTQQLLRTLMIFCPNLTYLYISFIKFSDQLLKFINSLRKLQFLTLSLIDNGSNDIVKIHVMQLAKILPLTLQYLDLEINWSCPHIDILLRHCDAPLKKLIISKDPDEKKIIDALIGFCVRKKSLIYVNIGRFWILNNFNNNYLNNLKKNLEVYIKLVPYECIIVNC